AALGRAPQRLEETPLVRRQPASFEVVGAERLALALRLDAHAQSRRRLEVLVAALDGDQEGRRAERAQGAASTPGGERRVEEARATRHGGAGGFEVDPVATRDRERAG